MLLELNNGTKMYKYSQTFFPKHISRPDTLWLECGTINGTNNMHIILALYEQAICILIGCCMHSSVALVCSNRPISFGDYVLL